MSTHDTEIIAENKWPPGMQFSMSPFGYTVSIKRTGLTETSVEYTCQGRECCKNPFKVSVDPRDMTFDSVRWLMRYHIDQAH